MRRKRGGSERTRSCGTGEASAQQTLQEVGELERQLRDEMQSKLARQTVTQVAALTGQALRSLAFDPYRAKLVDQDLTALRKSLRAYPSDRLRLQTQGLLQASVWSAEPLRAEERDSLRQMLQETFAENGGSTASNCRQRSILPRSRACACRWAIQFMTERSATSWSC